MRNLPWILLGLLACDDKTDSSRDSRLETGPVDVDQDGYPAAEDCADEDPTIHPDQAELCDGLDNNCDGQTDEDVLIAWYPDADLDGYGDPSGEQRSCEAPEGFVDQSGDCDDSDPRVHPDADESDCADPTDYNCDGSVGYADADNDGFAACEECDDSNATISPEATEVCDGLDNNCDGTSDEASAADAATWYQDLDADGYGDPDYSTPSCNPPAGYVADSSDCQDQDGDIHPNATERCDGQDNNCDGATDEASAADASTWYQDLDADGYGDIDYNTVSCAQPSGYVADASDCQDQDAAVHPAATEVCDSQDNDCDALTDDADPSLDLGSASSWYADSDGDGYGDAGVSALTCTVPSGHVADDQDCDDNDGNISPSAQEICDNQDNDCDTLIDDDDSSVDLSTGTSWYADFDGDGYGDISDIALACDQPTGRVSDDQDCDDSDSTLSPSATEICDGGDNNCDGVLYSGEGADSDSDSVIDCADPTYGTALSLDGGDYVVISNSTSANFTGSMTIEAWFRSTSDLSVVSSSEIAIVGKHVCGYSNGFFMGLNDYTGVESVAQLFVGSDPRLSGTTRLNDDTWHHIAGVFSGSSYALYVDGTLQKSGSTSYGTTNSTAITLGVHSTSSGCLRHGFVGRIDEVSLWSSARSASQIASDMSARLTGKESGLLMYWGFDERSGQSSTDLTGNGYTAVMGASSSVESSDPSWVDDGPF